MWVLVLSRAARCGSSRHSCDPGPLGSPAEAPSRTQRPSADSILQSAANPRSRSAYADPPCAAWEDPRPICLLQAERGNRWCGMSGCPGRGGGHHVSDATKHTGAAATMRALPATAVQPSGPEPHTQQLSGSPGWLSPAAQPQRWPPSRSSVRVSQGHAHAEGSGEGPPCPSRLPTALGIPWPAASTLCL